MGGSQEHIVMLPYMAHGHLIPFLALAKQILNTTDNQFTITIASTPLNTAYLRSLSPPDQIRLASLPFDPSEHNLPPNGENTESLSLDKVIKLFAASTTLEGSVLALVKTIVAQEGRPPLCIISDQFLGWANRVATQTGTVNVSFATGGAYGTSTYLSIWDHLPHRKTNSDEFNVPGFPDWYKFHVTQLHKYIRTADGNDNWSRVFQPLIRLSCGSFGWLCNTAADIEPFGLEAFKNYTKQPVWCIGPLLPQGLLESIPNRSFLGRHSGRDSGISPGHCLQWLDSHTEGSVLYISFGSQNSITATQMMELAAGLEDSGIKFIWCIRPPFGFDMKGEFKSEWLPNGFHDRIKDTNQGLLIPGWAPQLDILCHKSTGAFLSHCGWNSVVESLSQGVPIIGWPLAAEQAYNSKMLVEEMGVGLEIARGLQGSIDREGVRRVIDLVMENKSGKGKEMKKKAVEIGEMMRKAMSKDGSSVKAMNDFIESLYSARDMI